MKFNQNKSTRNSITTKKDHITNILISLYLIIFTPPQYIHRIYYDRSALQRLKISTEFISKYLRCTYRVMRVDASFIKAPFAHNTQEYI